MLFKALKENVGGDLNAYTNKEETVIYSAFLVEHFSRAAELLADIVFHSTFPQHEIDKEVEVIIDEIQYMKQEQLGSLIAALHRTNQLGYPVMIIGAGLPKIYKMLSDEKSYSERLFMYKQIGSLSLEQSKKAIEEPSKKFKVEYTEEAMKDALRVIKNLFLQW